VKSKTVKRNSNVPPGMMLTPHGLAPIPVAQPTLAHNNTKSIPSNSNNNSISTPPVVTDNQNFYQPNNNTSVNPPPSMIDQNKAKATDGMLESTRRTNPTASLHMEQREDSFVQYVKPERKIVELC
jgi:hypothetical protein